MEPSDRRQQSLPSDWQKSFPWRSRQLHEHTEKLQPRACAFAPLWLLPWPLRFSCLSRFARSAPCHGRRRWIACSESLASRNSSKRKKVDVSTRRRTGAVGGGAPSDRSSAAAARRSEQDKAAAKVVAQALAERKARDRWAVKRSARVVIAGDKRGATSAGGGEACRPRTRASQGVGVGGVKRGCGAGSPSGGAIAARASEEEEARVSRTARAAGPKRRLWRDVA